MSMMPMDNDPTGGLLSGLSFNKNYADSPLFHLGMGLLSVPGRSLDPGAVSWGPGLARGMQSLQQHKMSSGLLAEKQARTKLMQDKAEAERRKLEEAEAQRRAQEQAIQAQVAALPPEEQRKVRGLLDVDPDAGVEYLSNLIAPSGPENMFDLMMGSPDKWAEMVALKAKIEGENNPRGTNVTVRIPDTEKPVGKDAREYALPDGTTPNPMMSVSQITAAGGRVLSAKEKSQRKIKADIAAKEEEYARRVDEAQAAYNSAVASFKAAPGASTKRTLDEAAHNLRLTKGQQANISGEPSDFVSRGMTTPGATGLLADELIDRLMGRGKAPLDLGTVDLPGPGGRVKASDLIPGM